MQRWAFSEEGDLIEASMAIPHENYFCPECLEPLRVKKGEIRAFHFFHFQEGGSCRLAANDREHRKVQEFLAKELHENDCTIECPFPSIRRIADIAYHPKKVVFEIQLSPISAEEGLLRTKDYRSLGWHVIWLLHAKTFGKKRSSPFEESLLHIPHYFLDLDHPQGPIWDEASIARKGRRHFWFFPPRRLFLSPSSPSLLRNGQDEPLPPLPPSSPKEWQETRKHHWSCHLAGDFIDETLPETQKEIKNLPLLKHQLERLKLFIKLLWLHFLKS